MTELSAIFGGETLIRDLASFEWRVATDCKEILEVILKSLTKPFQISWLLLSWKSMSVCVVHVCLEIGVGGANPMQFMVDVSCHVKHSCFVSYLLHLRPSLSGSFKLRRALHGLFSRELLGMDVEHLSTIAYMWMISSFFFRGIERKWASPFLLFFLLFCVLFFGWTRYV